MSLDKRVIQAAIAETSSDVCHVDVFDELDSTNKHLARELATQSQMPLPTLCVARHQTAGVGRRGKAWHSPINSITLSIIQRFAQPSSALTGLSLVTGIALAELIREQIEPKCHADIGVKWPNDILIGQRKLGGILIEVPQTSQNDCTVITGIGINYTQGDELLRVDQPYAVLADLTNPVPGQSRFTGLIAGTVLEAYRLFEASGFAVFAERWAAVDTLKGRPVSVTQATAGTTASGNKAQPMTGTALGVSADGGLIIQHADQQKTWYSGEISVRADQD